ncbi:MAG: galactose-1-phosphate uridylyltransferase [Saccharofermentanales bacterium]
MAELRWNPFLQDWVMIASHRQERPQMPKNWCPFCPGSEKVPDGFTVLKYDNDFPALSMQPPVPDDVADSFFRTAPSYGKCEVILYTPEHTKSLSQLSAANVAELIDLWCERYIELSGDEKVKYVFIFENRGEVVGVTMPHPHGQIYAYPFTPKRISIEKKAMDEYRTGTGRCLHCDNLEHETAYGRRIIYRNASFVVFLPFYSEYPYGINIVPIRHYGTMTDMTIEERHDFALALIVSAGTLDSLFDKPFPYMMCFHNPPVHSDMSDDWHFHVEFFPPMRSEFKQKFNASSETGAWAHCNPTAPEEKAEELKSACTKFLAKL